ncbi:MAG: hypothetical protein HQK83_07690 [Fibrobacteria bacterium]|nr:hypothetical protein [Fibrobacteria bacterium]
METIIAKEKTFAARGYGYGFYSKDGMPVGSLDDMFWFIKSSAAKEHNFFNFNTTDLIPTKINIHGMLPILVMIKLGLKNFHHYSDFSDMVYWDNHPCYLAPANHALPMNYQKSTGFLHLNRGRFPENSGLGTALQAWYLKEFNLCKGPTISKFIEEHFQPIEQINNKLAQEEYFLKTRLKPYTDLVPLGRDFRRMQKKIKSIEQWSVFKKFETRCKVFLKKHSPVFRSMLNKIHNQIYEDTIWPRCIYDYYNKEIKIEEAQDETDFWWFHK